MLVDDYLEHRLIADSPSSRALKMRQRVGQIRRDIRSRRGELSIGSIHDGRFTGKIKISSGFFRLIDLQGLSRTVRTPRNHGYEIPLADLVAFPIADERAGDVSRGNVR